MRHLTLNLEENEILNMMIYALCSNNLIRKSLSASIDSIYSVLSRHRLNPKYARQTATLFPGGTLI